DDPDEGEVRVGLRGAGRIPPDIAVAPEFVGEALFTGQRSTRTLTIENRGGQDLNFGISVDFATEAAARGSPGRSLEAILADLNAGFTAVTGAIPDRFDFSEGETGSGLEDGGEDMYDGGNFLSTDLGGPLPYSDNAIASSPIFGGGRYFTRKYPGLFVLVADLRGVGEFTIAGDLGADGAGAADDAVLAARRHGITYRGFIKRVYGTADPSVNHLVIVADSPDLAHEFATNTNSDFHLVSGLAGSERVFSVLYAGRGGSYIDDAAARNIMEVLLDTLRLAPPWIDLAPVAGRVPPGGSVDLSVRSDASGLPSGDYAARVVIRSDDPDEPEVAVPANLRVTGAPDIALSDGLLDFGSVYSGAAGVRMVTVANAGAETLTVREVVSAPGAFMPDATALSLGPGETRALAVTFAPGGPGVYDGTLALRSDDPDEGEVTVTLRGEGRSPPDMAVMPASLEESLSSGQTSTRVLTIENRGGSDLAFAIEFRGASPPAPASRGTATASATVAAALVIQDVAPWGTGANQQILSSNGIAFEVIPSSKLASRDLSAYRLVLVPGDQPTLYYQALSGRADQLSGYVAGGGVLEFHAAGWGRAGGDASLVTLPGGMRIHQYFSTRNDVLDPLHRLTLGVPSPFFGDSASHAYFSGIPGHAARIAADEAGRANLVVYTFGSGTVVAGCQTFEYGHGRGQAAGDLLANMIPYAYGLSPRWISADPAAGVLPAGGSAAIAVNFDAAGLSDGAYATGLVIRGNDPDRPEVLVPASLQVAGAPEATLSEAALDYGTVFIGGSGVRSLTVSNSGTDILRVSEVSLDHPAFTAETAGFSLGVGGSRIVPVTFRPDRVGPFQGTLILRTSDPARPLIGIPLAGDGREAPVVGVQPASLAAIVSPVGHQMMPLGILNTGRSPLEFSLKVLGRPPAGAPPAACAASRVIVAENPANRLAAVNPATGAITRVTAALSGPADVELGAGGTIAYVTEIGSGELSEVRLDTGAVRRVASGLSSPAGLALDAARSTAYVTEIGSGELSAVDLATGAVTRVASMLSSPRGLALDAAGATAYVTEAGRGRLSAIDLATGAIRPVVTSGLNLPVGVALNATETFAYVTEANTGELSEVRLSTGHVRTVTLALSNPGGLALSSAGTIAYVTEADSRELSSVNLNTGVITRIAFGFIGPFGVDLVEPAGCAGEFLDLTPRAGSLPPDGFLSVDVLFGAAGLLPASYRADIVVSSNDPITPLLAVPASLTVATDGDGDGIPDPLDNCAGASNPLQEDADGDGTGDVCDNCAAVPNPTQTDGDADGRGTACDNCPLLPNGDQGDRDADMVGDLCDNCAAAANSNQEDSNQDGSGDACQPALFLQGVQQDGGEALEVRARALDPQGDPVSGSLEIRGSRPITLPEVRSALECGLGFLPDGIEGEGVAFAIDPQGAPFLFDLDSALRCGDGSPDYLVASGTCDRGEAVFDVRLSLASIAPPAPVCVRRLGGRDGGTDLTVIAFGERGLAARLEEVPVLAILFTARLPRRSAITGLEPGASYRIVISLTDGNTVPLRAEAEFLYQGESVLVINNPPRAALSAPAEVECDRFEGGVVTLDGTASEDADSSPGTLDDIVAFEWVRDPGQPTERPLGSGPVLSVALPVGDNVVGLRVTDSQGESGASGTVVIAVRDRAPPTLSLAADPAILWPPDHALLPVRVGWLASDLCDPTPRVTLLSATSSEPDDALGSGDGHTTGDIADARAGTPDEVLTLRAERSASGPGRVYTLTYRATDASGNSREAQGRVTVPHDLGNAPGP
ncbi:MAG: choice-of-anchor D domain-containing protein, partial [Acidobacteria bacterium]|nr:choice-of-anchor D domain-containing protein [Acidobacteriota bacterium]